MTACTCYGGVDWRCPIHGWDRFPIPKPEVGGSLVRVAVIDPTNGKIVARGESDGKRYDGMYLRVYRDGETDKSAAATLTYAASVFPEGRAEAISAELQRLRTIWKAAEDAYYKELYESANKYKAFTGTETSHA